VTSNPIALGITKISEKIIAESNLNLKIGCNVTKAQRYGFSQTSKKECSFLTY
jgi:hypothetical protein